MEEAQKALEILQNAIQMERDGRAFYLNAAENSQTALAKNLFRVLADEEIGHQKAAQEIYNAIKAGKDWPEQTVSETHTVNSESIFSAAMKDPHYQSKKTADDLEAVKMALEMEERSFKLYSERSKESVSEAEVSFYQALAHEERLHIVSLGDTEQYLTDPEGWIMEKQHITLDGD